MLRYNYYIDFYDKMKSRIFIFFIFFLMTVQGIHAQDLLPRQAVGDHVDRNIPDSISVGYILGGIDNNPDDSLTIDNLYKVLDEYNVKFKKIVVAKLFWKLGISQVIFAGCITIFLGFDILPMVVIMNSAIGKTVSRRIVMMFNINIWMVTIMFFLSISAMQRIGIIPAR